MNKESKSKSIKKLFSKSFQNVFGRLSLSGQKEQQFVCEESPCEEPAPSIADLLDFEYLYSSLKSVSEQQLKKCIESIKIMTHEPINMHKLLQVVYLGIDDEMYALRPITWRLLVGYLPPTRKQWINILEKNCESYKSLMEEYTQSKHKVSKKHNDHPLSRSKESGWNNHFED